MEMAINNANVRAQVNAHLAAGRFVIVERFTWLCRATDGIAGEGLAIAAVFSTREMADAYVASLDPAWAQESSWDVLPTEPIQPYTELETEDVPF